MQRLTFEEAQKKVADDFLKTMKDEGFETFEEMKKCYWWETDDIKEEVDAILYDTNWHIDEEDSHYMWCYAHEYNVEYKKFINGVYKLIKSAQKEA